jgi:hypothetical protein
MTKTLLTFLLTSILSLTIFGQTDNAVIEKTFKEYFHTIEQKDNEKTLDYIYPKLFDHFPKDRMLQEMNKMKADTSTNITLANSSVTSISETLDLDGIQYALIKYSFNLTMTLKTSLDKPDSEEESDFNSGEFTYEMLKEEYGDKNVNYDRENNRLDIIVTNEMYAIKDPAYIDWKFLEKKDNMKPILEKLLPKKVLKKW